MHCLHLPLIGPPSPRTRLLRRNFLRPPPNPCNDPDPHLPSIRTVFIRTHLIYYFISLTNSHSSSKNHFFFQNALTNLETVTFGSDTHSMTTPLRKRHPLFK